MNDLKELDEVQTAKNAYRLIIESGHSIEDISLYLKISERLSIIGELGNDSQA